MRGQVRYSIPCKQVKGRSFVAALSCYVPLQTFLLQLYRWAQQKKVHECCNTLGRVRMRMGSLVVQFCQLAFVT